MSENCESPQEDYSSKFYSMKTECYFGNPGNYWSFEFGLYEGGGASYNQSFNDNINASPFNYVSIGREKTTPQAYFSEI